MEKDKELERLKALEKDNEVAVLRLVTRFGSVAEAEAACKRLEIFDAQINLSDKENRFVKHIPKPLRDKWIRLGLRAGVTWRVVEWDGEVNYVFVPCSLLLRGLNAQSGFGWQVLAREVVKEFKRIEGYLPRFLFITRKDAKEKNVL